MTNTKVINGRFRLPTMVLEVSTHSTRTRTGTGMDGQPTRATHRQEIDCSPSWLTFLVLSDFFGPFIIGLSLLCRGRRSNFLSVDWKPDPCKKWRCCHLGEPLIIIVITLTIVIFIIVIIFYIIIIIMIISAQQS